LQKIGETRGDILNYIIKPDKTILTLRRQFSLEWIQVPSEKSWFESRQPLQERRGACLTKMSIQNMLVRYSLTARAQGESEDTIKHTGRAYLTRWAILTTMASEAISSVTNVSVL